MLLVDTDSMEATFDGRRFHQPFTSDAEDGRVYSAPIAPEVFSTIDFSQIRHVALLAGDTQLAIDHAGGWGRIYLRAM